MIDRRLIKSFDYPLFFITVLLILLGILVIFSATSKNGEVTQDYFIKQIYWFAGSLVIFFICLSVNYESFDRWAYVFYGISILSLIAVFFFPAFQGAKRWIVLGPIRIQSAEIAKIAAILALGKHLKKRDRKIQSFKDMIIPFLLIGLPVVLILKQPDLGSSLTFFPILIAMLYISGLPFLYVFLIVSPLISAILYQWIYVWIIYIIILGLLTWWKCHSKVDAILSIVINIFTGILTSHLWGFLKDYQKKRLLSFLNPEFDPLGSGYHLIQSKITIGSGGFFGKGYMSGTQTNLDFLPAQHTDFIFSVIGEEFGLIGSVIILSLFSFIILRGIDIAAKSKNIYGSLIASGIIAVISFHIIINIGMTIGILPITGIPLPFISYGGSSLIIFMIMISMLINIGMRRFD